MNNPVSFEIAKLLKEKVFKEPSTIIRCCKNKQKTANNFIWIYSKN